MKVHMPMKEGNRTYPSLNVVTASGMVADPHNERSGLKRQTTRNQGYTIKQIEHELDYSYVKYLHYQYRNVSTSYQISSNTNPKNYYYHESLSQQSSRILERQRKEKTAWKRSIIIVRKDLKRRKEKEVVIRKRYVSYQFRLSIMRRMKPHQDSGFIRCPSNVMIKASTTGGGGTDGHPSCRTPHQLKHYVTHLVSLLQASSTTPPSPHSFSFSIELWLSSAA